jgi:hypothetical protein
VLTWCLALHGSAQHWNLHLLTSSLPCLSTLSLHPVEDLEDAGKSAQDSVILIYLQIQNLQQKWKSFKNDWIRFLGSFCSNNCQKISRLSVVLHRLRCSLNKRRQFYNRWSSSLWNKANITRTSRVVDLHEAPQELWTFIFIHKTEARRPMWNWADFPFLHSL